MYVATLREANLKDSSLPPFIEDQKVPLAPLVQWHGQFTGQKGGEKEGGGRNGHRGGAGPNWSKVWEGINGQMCPNPTHLMREETGEEGQQESKSGIGQCSMGGKNGSRGTMLQQHR